MSLDTNGIVSKGRVERWHILPKPPQIDYLDCLQQDDAGLTIFLRPVEFNGYHLTLGFDNPISIRNSQEGLWFNSVDPIEKELWGTTFFIVTNSAYVRQFHEYSSWAFEDWKITHYAIFTSNFCVEVLSTVEPALSWEKNPLIEKS